MNDKPSPAFFTDQDQAEQFVKREIHHRPLTLMAFDHPADLMAFIYSLPGFRRGGQFRPW
ncbi:MAG: hypothetical protein U0903_01315 [Planctomycetales bacterium]